MPEKFKKAFITVDIISFAALILSISLFIYLAFYKTADNSIKHFSSLTQKAETELGRVKKLQTPQKKDIKEYTLVTEAPKTELTNFLQRINEELITSGLELDNIEKSDIDDYTYNLVVYAPFDKLSRFLFKIEQSNFAIQDLDIHPYSTDKNLINLTLRLIGNEMSSDEREALENFQKDFPEALRNPFKKDAIVREAMDRPHDKTPIINLTWKYHLTGIGFDRDHYATIDHKNYYKGDTFNGMRIDRIETNKVYLKSGSQEYIISFRYKTTLPTK